MAATEQEISDARADARLALLQAIKRKADKGADDEACQVMAEAYAWLEWPNQSHG